MINILWEEEFIHHLRTGYPEIYNLHENSCVEGKGDVLDNLRLYPNISTF